MRADLNSTDGWHSWDSTPWRHPWLSSENLSEMRDYSRQLRDNCAEAVQLYSKPDPWPLQRFLQRFRRRYRQPRFAFVGNIANHMYLRAQALKTMGVDVDIYGHPQDTYVMSYPEWEEMDDEPNTPVTTIEELRQQYPCLPKCSRFHVIPELSRWRHLDYRLPRWARMEDYRAWPAYFSQLPTLKALQSYDCLLAMQVQYLAYLSGKPYFATKSGGDVWFEASRNDELGSLQRRAFSKAAAFFITNPWGYAFARRLGLVNVITLPLVLDQNKYTLGEPEFREEWRGKVGGDFFVLQTARMDRQDKGSEIAAAGFAKFAREHSDARLVLTAWGNDKDSDLGLLRELGVADQCLILPICGKKRLIRYLRSADCLLDQFRLGYYGGTALEALACGLPVVMRIEQEQYDAFCETGAPPVCNADSPDSIARQLTTLYRQNALRRKTASEGRAWFLANHGSERWAPEYANMLNALAIGYHFDFSSSPLARPLSKIEIEYHDAELAKAPPISYP